MSVQGALACSVENVTGCGNSLNSLVNWGTAPTIDKRYTDSLMVRKPNVTDGFMREVASALSGSIPVNVRAALQRSGYKVTVSRTVPDAVPSTKNQAVRGYAHSSTWNNVFGMFNRETKQVVMAEYAESEPDTISRRMVTLNDYRRRRGILKHECGHAVDQMIGNFSHKAEFTAVYKKGVARLSKDDRKMLAYYLQPGDAGKEEAFAEVFAIACGNGCHQNTDALFHKHFPELISLVSNRIQTIK